MIQPTTARFTLTYCVAGSQKSSVTLDYGQVLIGRGSDCQVIIEDPQASRHHAALDLKPDGITLTDLGSHNGTFLAGKRIPPRKVIPLKASQPFYIGAVEFSVLDRSLPSQPPQARAGTAAQPPSISQDMRSKNTVKWLLLILLVIIACALAAGGGALILWGSQAQQALPPGYSQLDNLRTALALIVAAGGFC